MSRREFLLASLSIVWREFFNFLWTGFPGGFPFPDIGLKIFEDLEFRQEEGIFPLFLGEDNPVVNLL